MGLCVELNAYLSSLLGTNHQSLKAVGFGCISVMFPSLSEKTIIRCTENYLDRQWYDFVAVKINNNVVAAKVCGILVIQDEIRIVIHPMKVNNNARRRSNNDSVNFQCTTNNILWISKNNF